MCLANIGCHGHLQRVDEWLRVNSDAFFGHTGIESPGHARIAPVLPIRGTSPSSQQCATVQNSPQQSTAEPEQAGFTLQLQRGFCSIFPRPRDKQELRPGHLKHQLSPRPAPRIRVQLSSAHAS
ncbi:hypothetical protein VTH06DRAFT_6374 [Thermothelomyces fergusii]